MPDIYCYTIYFEQRNPLLRHVYKSNPNSKLHGYVYDGIWTIGLALNNTSHFYSELDPDATITSDILANTSLIYNNPLWDKALSRALRATSFIGVTVSLILFINFSFQLLFFCFTFRFYCIFLIFRVQWDSKIKRGKDVHFLSSSFKVILIHTSVIIFNSNTDTYKTYDAYMNNCQYAIASASGYDEMNVGEYDSTSQSLDLTKYSTRILKSPNESNPTNFNHFQVSNINIEHWNVKKIIIWRMND